MAKTDKSRKQLLNEPDQFITFSGKLIAFGRSHAKTLLICTGVAVALLLSAVIIRQVSETKEKRASEMVEAAVAKYTAALQDTDPKTAYERVKTDFEDIFDRYGSQQTAKAARLVYADISYKGADADTAVSLYTQALEDFKQTAALKNIILSGLGHAYLLKSEYPESIRYFEMITSGNQKDMRSDALFNLALLYEKTGEAAKSKALYQQLLAEFPDAMVVDLVKEKISG
jgi:tetratricopeptide (TPR) repeat protein